MLIVTGGAGFIGSNLVHELNAHGITDILVVDNLANARKFENLYGAHYVDYMDKREFRRAIAEDALGGAGSRRSCIRGPAPTRWRTTART